MNTLKRKLCMLLSITLTLCFLVSCGDDDEPAADEIHDFFWEVSLEDRGYLSASAANSFETGLNSLCGKYENQLVGINANDAIYLHDKLIEAFRIVYSDNSIIPASYGTIRFTITLKMENGKAIKKNTLTVNKDGCSVK